MNNYKEIETEIDNFLSDNLEGYYLNNKCVGINCDYILTLNYDNEKISVKQIDIQQNFNQEQKFIYDFFNLLITDDIDVSKLYDFLLKSNLLILANDLVDKYGGSNSYDYCICLDGRYLPKISLDIKANLECFLKNIEGNKALLESGYYYHKNRLEIVKKYYLNNDISNFKNYSKYLYVRSKKLLYSWI